MSTLPEEAAPLTEAAPETSAEEKPAAPAEPSVGIGDVAKVVAAFLRQKGWIFLLAATVLLVGYYTLFPSRGYFHSDTADSIMWAVASNESGSLFNQDFTYACLLPFSTTLIMTALIPLTGVTMLTHVVSMFIFFVLFTVSLVWMLRSMGWSWNYVSVTVFTTLLICSSSEKLREIFWGHSIYYSLGVFFIFVGLSLLFRYMDKVEAYRTAAPEGRAALKRSIIITMVLLLVWFLLTGMDQIASISIFALPAMAAVFTERWLDGQHKLFTKRTLPALLIFVIMGAGMVGGYFLTTALSQGITAGYETAYSTYSAMDTWDDNLLGFPTAWFSLLGASMADGEALMSAKSIGDLLRVITGVVLLVLPTVALCCYPKIRDRKLHILILTYWFMLMIVMMGYIMGKLSAANWRLSPIVAVAAVVSVAFLRWAAGQVQMQRVISLMMIPVFAICVLSAVDIVKMKPDNTDRSELYTLSEVLESRGLTYGYANFWHANGMTIVSDSKVKCRSVNISETGCDPYYYQGCRSWYRTQPGQQKYFLLLSAGERTMLENSGSPLATTYAEDINVNGFTIWVYGENLFS